MMIIRSGAVCSHCCGATPNRPTTRLRVECSPPASIEIHMKPATTSGTALGSRIAERNSGRRTIRRLSAMAEKSPRTNWPTMDDPKTKIAVMSSEFQNPSSANSRSVVPQPDEAGVQRRRTAQRLIGQAEVDRRRGRNEHKAYQQDQTGRQQKPVLPGDALLRRSWPCRAFRQKEREGRGGSTPFPGGRNLFDTCRRRASRERSSRSPPTSSWCTRHPRYDVIFGAELRAARRRRPASGWSSSTPTPHGMLDAAAIATLVPDLHERSTWACGPVGMLEALEAHWETAASPSGSTPSASARRSS